jgi:hypothetical protein
MNLRAKAAMFVDYGDIPTYLELGWMAEPPTHFDYHNLYGIIMFWLCDCKPPYLRRHL